MHRNVLGAALALGMSMTATAGLAATASAWGGERGFSTSDDCTGGDGAMEISITGDWGRPSVSVATGAGPLTETDVRKGRLTAYNDTRTLTCPVFVEIWAVVSADLGFPDPFEDVGLLTASAYVTIRGNGSDRTPPIDLSSADLAQPYPPGVSQTEFVSFTRTVFLRPGQSAFWNVEVGVAASVSPVPPPPRVPLPPAAALLAGGLCGLAGLSRRRRG